MTPPLFHYTCDHAVNKIVTAGHLLPAVHLLPRKALLELPPEVALVAQLIWLTDMTSVSGINRHKLGLTNHLDQTCDRTRWRFRVTDLVVPAVPWSRLRLRWLKAAPVHNFTVHQLEEQPGVEPERWWVTAGPVNVALDQHRTAVVA